MNAWVIDCWKGGLHDRAKALFRRALEHFYPEIRLQVLENYDLKLHHWEALAEIWERERESGNQHVILTEWDYLPNPRTFRPTERLTAKTPVLCCEYVTRAPRTKLLESHGFPGAFYFLIDKLLVPDIDFSPGGMHNNPANLLDAYLQSHYGVTSDKMPPYDRWPTSLGVEYYTGTHLMWMRHWNDPPNTVVVGFRAIEFTSGVTHELDLYEERLDDLTS